MPRIVKKTVFIFADCWEVMRTSRLLQAVGCGVVILLVCIGYVYARYARQYREEAQIERAKQEEKATFTRTNFNFSVLGDPADIVVLGVATSGINDSLGEIVKTELRSSLGTMFPSLTFAPAVLLPPFYRAGLFQDVFQGNTSPLNRAEVFSHAKSLMLISPQVSFKDSVIGGGMRSCSVHVMCHAFHSLSSPMREIDISLVGLGSTAESSLTKALETFKDHQKELEPLLK